MRLNGYPKSRYSFENGHCLFVVHINIDIKLSFTDNSKNTFKQMKSTSTILSEPIERSDSTDRKFI